MRDRLIELLEEYSTHPEKSCPRYGTNKGCRGCNYELADGCDYTGRRADHLLAAGVIVPPCKVGDVVYVPWEWEGQKGIASPIVECIQIVRDTKLCGFFIDMKSDDTAFNDVYGFWRTFADIGKTVFLTREEAEKALKERRDG